MVDEGDADETVGGLLERGAKLRRAEDELVLLVVGSRDPGRVELQDADPDTAGVADVDPPGTARVEGAGGSLEAMGEGVEGFEPPSEVGHGVGVGHDLLEDVGVEALSDKTAGADLVAVDVVVAGDEEETLVELEPEVLGELAEEEFGLVVLFGLSGEGDVAGDEDEVGPASGVFFFALVLEEGLEGGAAVPAFVTSEVEVGEVEPADGVAEVQLQLSGSSRDSSTSCLSRRSSVLLPVPLKPEKS